MTSADALAAVLAATGPVLLDFDGPLTPLMPKPRNRAVADAVRDVLRTTSRHELPPAISATTDHLVILRHAYAEYPGEVAHAVEDAVNREEVTAALVAQPTAGAVDLLRAFRQTQRPMVVVSNNGADAITAFLTVHRLDGFILAVIGRPAGHPDLMKPHPHSVRVALAILEASADRCVMIGDSTSDVQASHAAKVRIIGFAKNPERGLALAAAGADALVDNMSTLAATVVRARLLD